MGKPRVWTALEGAKEIHDLALRLGAEDPVVHNLFASLLLRIPEGSAVNPVYLRPAGSDSEPLEAAWNSGKNLILSHLEFEGLLPLAHQFEGVELPGVIGPLDSAEGFVEAYAAVVGVRPRKWINQGLYRCDELQIPRGVKGTARFIRDSDLEWMTHSLRAFTAESVPHDGFDEVAFRRDFHELVQKKRFMIWEDEGESCSLAAFSGLTPWSQRIGPVYTLPAHRGRGYAAAVTAEITEQILHAGRIPCLYTNLSNPVSNRVYQRLGFREVSRSLHAVYQDAPAT